MCRKRAFPRRISVRQPNVTEVVDLDSSRREDAEMIELTSIGQQGPTHNRTSSNQPNNIC